MCKVWVWLAALLLSVIIGVRLDVLFTYQGNDMMTSFQVVASGLGSGDDTVKNSGRDGFFLSMIVFSVLATLARRTDHAGPVHDAAVHAGVARLADRPAHR